MFNNVHLRASTVKCVKYFIGGQGARFPIS